MAKPIYFSTPVTEGDPFRNIFLSAAGAAECEAKGHLPPEQIFDINLGGRRRACPRCFAPAPFESPLAGKRIQVIKKVRSPFYALGARRETLPDSYTLRIYSGTHRVADLVGTDFHLEAARKRQKRIARIMGLKITHKVGKPPRRLSRGL